MNKNEIISNESIEQGSVAVNSTSLWETKWTGTKSIALSETALTTINESQFTNVDFAGATRISGQLSVGLMNTMAFTDKELNADSFTYLAKVIYDGYTYSCSAKRTDSSILVSLSKQETLIPIPPTSINNPELEPAAIVTRAMLKITSISQTSPLVMTGIYIAEPPSKVVYKKGEYFNGSYMELRAVYTNGYEERVTNYSHNPSVLNSINIDKVTISYGGFSVDQPIQVFDKFTKPDYSELEIKNGIGNASINLNTRRVKFTQNDIGIGANTFKINVRHTYNSDLKMYLPPEINTAMPKGFKLNCQQYVFRYRDEYRCDGFAIGDIVYVDEEGNLHCFKRIATGSDTYYDTSGLGLTLTIEEDTATSVRVVISDDAKNKMVFESCSAMPSLYSTGICLKELHTCIDFANGTTYKKVITIDDQGRPASICDYRKPDRKIEFDYDENSGLLTQIKNESSEGTISCDFNYSNGKLSFINRTSRGTTRKETVFNYSADGLQYVYNCVNNETVFFQYENEEVCCAQVGSASLQESTNTVTGFTMLTSSTFTSHVYSKEYEEINYIDGNSVSVTNEKDVTLEYFFNSKGKVVSVLEREAEGAYRTLDRETGIEIPLTTATSETETINGKNVVILSMSAVGGLQYPNHTIDINPGTELYQTLDTWRSKQSAVVTISFWMKYVEDLGYPSKCYFRFGISDNFHSKNTYFKFDDTASNVWQFVSFRYAIDHNTDISHITFGKTDDYSSIRMAGLHISLGDQENLWLSSDGDALDNRLVDFKYVQITQEDVVNTYEINRDFYFSPEDVELTVKNMYLAGKTNNVQNPFVVVCCNNTKKMANVSVVKFKKGDFDLLSLWDWVNQPAQETLKNTLKNGLQYSYDEYCTALDDREYVELYVNGGYGKDQDMVFCILQLIDNFEVAKNVDCTTATLSLTLQSDGYSDSSAYRQTHIVYVGDVTKFYSFNPNMVKETTRTWVLCYTNWGDISEEYRTVDYLGRKEKEQDSHGVSTEYSYDNYGNLECVIKTGSDNSKMRSETIYDDTNAQVREIIVGQKENNIITNYAQSLPSGIMLSSSVGGGETEGLSKNIAYDDFFRPITMSTEGNIINPTSLQYDKDRISQASTTGAPTFAFQYDSFGRLICINDGSSNKIFENVFSTNKITKHYYNSLDNTSVTVESNLNKYDKLTSVVDETDVTTNTVSFEYEGSSNGFGASASCANVMRINDGFDGKTYDTEYDAISGEVVKQVVKNNGVDLLKIERKDVNEVTMYFRNTDSYDVLEDFEHKASSARITSTNYILRNDESSRFLTNYTYDDLGRINKKTCVGDTNYVYKTYSLDGVTYQTNIVNGVSATYNNQVKHSFAYSHDNRGNVTQCIDNEGTKTNYTYDALDRLISEKVTNSSNTIAKHIKYQYNVNGQLERILDATNNDAIIKSFSYTNGRMNCIYVDTFTIPYRYDAYGNIVAMNNMPFTWIRGNLLKSYDGNTYTYNHAGVRTSKVANNGVTTTYFVDGAKILGEDRSDGKQLRYFYDATGIAGFTYNGTLYYYGKDALGNVRKIYDVNMNLVGSYDYDGFGSITNGLTTIASINPIRWKSHYYDVETGWYNINSRYYDPSIAQYITVSPAEDLLQEIGSLQGWNRYSISYTNAVCMEGNIDNIAFSKFAFSPNYWLPIRFIDESELPAWIANILHGLVKLYKKIRQFINSVIENGLLYTIVSYLEPVLQEIISALDLAVSVEDVIFNSWKPLSVLLSVKSKIFDATAILGFGFVVMGAVVGIFENIRAKKSAEYIAGNALYDLATGGFAVVISIVLSSKFGIYGAMAGIVIGIGLSYLFSLIKQEVNE